MTYRMYISISKDRSMAPSMHVSTRKSLPPNRDFKFRTIYDTPIPPSLQDIYNFDAQDIYFY